jgi:hypothetical protein
VRSRSSSRPWAFRLLRVNPERHDAVTRHRGRVPVRRRRLLLVRPQVAHRGRAALRRCLGPLHFDLGRRRGAIQQRDGLSAVGQRLHPHLLIPVIPHARALLAQGVLVDGDDVLVRQDRFDLGRHRADVIAGNERRGEHGPHGEMRLVLRLGQAGVSDLQHVGVVPAVRPGVLRQRRQQVDDLRDAEAAPLLLAVPARLDVASRPPEVPDALCPEPRLVGSPLAHAEHDGAAGGVERFPHRRVRDLRIDALVIAPVVLQVVHAPRRVLGGVLVLVAVAARPILAGARSGVRIDAELEALRVDVVGKRLHVGESLRIRHDGAIGLA